jgi:hypothetical protein
MQRFCDRMGPHGSTGRRVFMGVRIDRTLNAARELA